jgi:hypothetical protein
MTYNLYVPAEGVRHNIILGSAIVGEEDEEGWVHTHYEGGGASNVQTFEEKITHAAGRRSERYPTSALRSWEKEDLVLVGTVKKDDQLRHWVIESITNELALRNWVGPDQDLVCGGSDKLYVEKGGFLVSKMPIMEQSLLLSSKMTLVDKCKQAVDYFRRKESR